MALCKETAEQQELLSQVFKPGNLVWGTHIININHFTRIISSGIKTQQEVGITNYGYTPDTICLAMLSQENPPDNYNLACHVGPKRFYDNNQSNISIIINRDTLISRYPVQIKAVGSYFTNPERLLPQDYNFDLNYRTVFGIPIEEEGRCVWTDEVNVYPSKEQASTNLPTIPNSCWTGIVLNNDLFYILKQAGNSYPHLQLPVFNPYFELLDMVL